MFQLHLASATQSKSQPLELSAEIRATILLALESAEASPERTSPGDVSTAVCSLRSISRPPISFKSKDEKPIAVNRSMSFIPVKNLFPSFLSLKLITEFVDTFDREALRGLTS